MNRNFFSFPVNSFDQTKQQVLTWINQFSTCCFLDNHHYQLNHHSYECIAAAGVNSSIAVNAGTALSGLNSFQQKHKDWLFGHLSYDLKNEIEALDSVNPDRTGFPDLFFFVPHTILLLNKDELCISAAGKKDADAVFDALRDISPEPFTSLQPIEFKSRLSKQAYIDTIEKLRSHILRGDCYEINFCQEFFSEDAEVNPLAVYQSLSNISPSPFAAYYKIDHRYLCCASPERYLKKDGNNIISQPIKGTAKRNAFNSGSDDAANRENLYNSAKDRAENVMVVDLVRNDLSKICREGSVQVDELFGIYSFPQVHQMISTVSGTLQTGIDFTAIVAKTFPMGSMTGAPKKKVMQLIDHYETTRRGLFSGAVGYIDPVGDFDFNVVIRSILYNSQRRYLSYLVGSGITFYSNAEEEYEECLLKAEAIKKVFA